MWGNITLCPPLPGPHLPVCANRLPPVYSLWSEGQRGGGETRADTILDRSEGAKAGLGNRP